MKKYAQFFVLLAILALASCGKESIDDNRLDHEDFYDQNSEISYTINGNNFIYKTASPEISSFFNTTHSGSIETVIRLQYAGNIKMELAFNGTNTGNFQCTHFVENSLPAGTKAENISVAVSSYGITGYFIKGSFAGTIKHGISGAIMPIYGTFKVKR